MLTGPASQRTDDMNDTGPVTETDLVRHYHSAPGARVDAALAARVAADPAAAALLADWARQDAALQAALDPVLQAPVPDRLKAVLRDARPSLRPRLLYGAGLAAMLVIGAAGGITFSRLSRGDPQEMLLSDAALRTFAIYSVEAVHPVEVGADEVAHLTTWLSKRLGHPLVPPDFSALGFRLMGGRVVPFDAGPSALLMYEDDRGRRITLQAAPGRAGGDAAFRFSESDLAQSFTWVDGDISYAVTGDIPRDTLRAIAVAAYDQLI